MKQIFLIGALAVSTACLGQKVSSKLTFQPGQKYEITTIVDNVNTTEMMGQSMDMKMNMTTTRVLDVGKVDKNVATIESKVKRMQYNFEGMGQSQKFDSENEADMKGEGGKMAEKALKNKFSMKVDASGKILEVTPDDNNPNKADAAVSGSMGGPMDGMMEGFDLPKTGSRIDLSVLPAGDVSKGSSWTDTTSGNGDEKRKAAYTITGVTDNEVLIDYTEEVAATTTREQMGMEVNIQRKDQSSGKITLDRKTGLLKQQVVTTKTEATAEVMGQRMPVNATTTKTVTVKAM